jgi:hypothetical protein
VFRACSNQTLDDYWIGIGLCINGSEGRDVDPRCAQLPQ